MLFLQELYDFVQEYKKKNTGLRVFIGSEKTIKIAWRCTLKYAVEGDELTNKFIDLKKLSAIMHDRRMDADARERKYTEEQNKQYNNFKKKFLELI